MRYSGCVKGYCGCVDAKPTKLRSGHQGAVFATATTATPAQHSTSFAGLAAVLQEHSLFDYKEQLTWRKLGRLLLIPTNVMVISQVGVRLGGRGGSGEQHNGVAAVFATVDVKVGLHARASDAAPLRHPFVALQGLFGCLPWGMILTYLNDYLSHNKGLSIQTATLVGDTGWPAGLPRSPCDCNAKARWPQKALLRTATPIVALAVVPPPHPAALPSPFVPPGPAHSGHRRRCGRAGRRLGGAVVLQPPQVEHARLHW